MFFSLSLSLSLSLLAAVKYQQQKIFKVYARPTGEQSALSNDILKLNSGLLEHDKPFKESDTLCIMYFLDLVT